jgi:hypothetical protein
MAQFENILRMRLTAMAMRRDAAGTGSAFFTESAASDGMEWGGTNVLYEASSGDVHAQVRQSCFAHVLQGGWSRCMANSFTGIRT